MRPRATSDASMGLSSFSIVFVTAGLSRASALYPGERIPMGIKMWMSIPNGSISDRSESARPTVTACRRLSKRAESRVGASLTSEGEFGRGVSRIPREGGVA